ncbi:MAG: hypothetical protein ABJG68_07265 [Crocinitomicaceae bacterium]
MELLDNYAIYILATGAVLTAILFLLRNWIGYKKFKTTTPVNFLFEEKQVSGYSMNSLMKKMVPVKNALIVNITENELWLSASFMNNSLVMQFGMHHRIDRDKITHAELIENEMVLIFKTEKGKEKEVHLVLKEPELFLKILNSNGIKQPFQEENRQNK